MGSIESVLEGVRPIYRAAQYTSGFRVKVRCQVRVSKVDGAPRRGHIPKVVWVVVYVYSRAGAAECALEVCLVEEICEGDYPLRVEFVETD